MYLFTCLISLYEPVSLLLTFNGLISNILMIKNDLVKKKRHTNVMFI